MGPSQHSSKELRDIHSDLFFFHKTITNLDRELKTSEEDQGRLKALRGLQKPLETSQKALDTIKTRLEDVTFMRKHVFGARFDQQVKVCLRSSAHLLVTLRPASSIPHELHDAIRLEIHASDTDLENYTRFKTRQDRCLARYRAQDPPFQEEVVAKIVGNARGMWVPQSPHYVVHLGSSLRSDFERFLLVQSHLESLAKQKTKKDMRKALSSLPKGLNKTYDDAMKKIRSQDPESVRVAEHVLA